MKYKAGDLIYNSATDHLYLIIGTDNNFSYIMKGVDSGWEWTVGHKQIDNNNKYRKVA